ncbi:MAG: conjugal transfer protein TraX [Treponema sp.]|jgi:hypothetical protein|nr:conjugal transfer protein TraX [Treponema sp.]
MKTKILPLGPHKWGILSGTAVKIIGLVLMVMDHFYQMFGSLGAPGWLYWFGRPVAVMFIFLCAEGFYYTRSPKKYLLRLLAGFLFMALGNRILSQYMPVEEIVLINNIFGTLFLAAFYMWMADLVRAGFKEKKAGKVLLAAGGILLPLVISAILLLALNAQSHTAVLILTFIPNPLAVEGGFIYIILGLLFYLLHKYRAAQIGVVLAAAVFSWYAAGGFPNPAHVEWLMAAGAIPILLYNGKRGGGNKYFFYIFYPAHIYLFYIAAWFIRSW